MREEIGDGCLAAAGRFISGVRLGKRQRSAIRAAAVGEMRGWGKRQIILGGRKSCVIFAYYELN